MKMRRISRPIRVLIILIPLAALITFIVATFGQLWHIYIPTVLVAILTWMVVSASQNR